MICRVLLVCLFGLLETTAVPAQDSVDTVISLPQKYLSSIDKKTAGLDKQLTRRSEKYLSSLSKQEEKIRRELARADSSKAAELFGDTKKTYEQLSQKLNAANGKLDKAFSGQYLPGLDSLQGSLGFLKDAKNLISKSKDIRQQLSNSIEQVKQLQNKLQQADEIKQYVQQRQEQLKTLLSSYTNLPKGITKHLGKYQHDVYYYGRQVQEYKETLNDPDKLFKKVLATLQTLPAFRQFMQQHSMLAQLFPTPENYNPGQPVQGLAAREQVMAVLQSQSGISNSVSAGMAQQNITAAQGQVDELRDQLGRLGINGGSDLTMPDFKPDGLPTLSFLNRLEYGVQFQSQRATDYFPSSTDILVTIGYKLDKKTVIGAGLSGKIGWGQGWKKIDITARGVGFRVYADWKVPPLWNGKNETLWLTGGGEMNYIKPVESLAVFKNYRNWNKSALIGLSKKFRVSAKLQGNISFLYDFLYQQNIPVSKPFLFRMGYNL